MPRSSESCSEMRERRVHKRGIADSNVTGVSLYRQ